MERKLVSVQKIVNIKPIEGADKIEVAQVEGFEVIIAKADKHKVGELIVYCECDTILPQKPEFEFLRERKFRIRIIKLRGQVSEGIVFPLSILPKGKYKEGQDLTELIGATKYDPQLAAELKEQERLSNLKKGRLNKFLRRYKWYRKLVFKPSKFPFPEWITKTDELRGQNLKWDELYEWNKDVSFEVTEKVDGQSGTWAVRKNKHPLWYKFGKDKYSFVVCSRNFQIVKKDNSSYWTIAEKYDIKKKLINMLIKDNLNTIVLQGEILGPGIQKNKYKFKEYELLSFNLKFDNTKLNYYKISSYLTPINIKLVPLAEETLLKLKPTIREMVEYSKGNSMENKDMPREGVVIRNYEKHISFKVINPDFLLKYGE